MRNISQLSLQKIAQTDGLEPINFVDVNWGGRSVIRYSDQKTPDLQGKIVELTDLENVVNISGHTSTQSINIKLDDTDGSIKQIIDSVDIHKSDVKVYQWFKGIPLSDAFIVFEGQLSTPIVWSEGDRTLSFAVVSKLEDAEVGFSAEEGDFPWIPPEIIGKAWPLTFGSPDKVPALRMEKIPSGALANLIGIGVKNINPTHYFKLVENNTFALEKARLLAEECFIFALEAYATASAYAFDQTVENINAQATVDNGGTPLNFTSQIDQYNRIGDEYTQKGNEYLFQVQEIIHNGVLVFEEVDNQPGPGGFTAKDLQKAEFQIANGFDFPQQSSIGINIGGAHYTGQFDGTNFTVQSFENPLQRVGIQGSGPINVADQPASTHYQQDLSNTDIWLGQPGTLVVIAETFEYPISYVAALNHVTVRNVWAYKSITGLTGDQAIFNGTRVITPVPPSYYQVIHQVYDTISATFIQMIRPLSSYKNEGWEDEIYCDITSDVGSNVADVLQYLITVWTNHACDPVSFNHVRSISGPYPMDFALLRRDNIIKVLQEIAFQARLAIWFSNGVFYLKYLPEEGTSVDTITDSDVEAGTMELTCTDTENLVTKFTATWKLDGATPDYTAIFRHNILKYGVIEDNFSFYAYKYQQLVEKSSIFWMIRRANTWKQLKFSTFLTKLNLETYDMVTLNLNRNFVSNGPVLCMVQNCKYDSANNRIDLVLWVPVRFGEMTKYPFAMPSAVDETIIFPLPQDQGGGGGSGSSAKGSLPIHNNRNQSTRPHPDRGSNTPQNNPGTYVPQPSDLSDQTPSGGTFVQPFVDPRLDVGTQTTRTHHQWDIKSIPPTTLTQDSPGIFPGEVVARIDGNNYQVNVFLQGIDGDKTLVQARRLNDPNDSEPIEPGTPVFVNKSVWFETTGPDFDPKQQIRVEYTIDVTSTAKASGFPGIVREQDSGQTYNVDIFKQGLDGQSESVLARQMGTLATDELIPNGTPVQVFRNSWTDPDTEAQMVEYTMNVPTWLDPQED